MKEVLRYGSLDIWRGVACIIVVIHHSVFTGGGEETTRGEHHWWIHEIAARLWIGVPMFFVISGYCISASADRWRRDSRGASQFFLRRFRRIYPPCWILLALTALIVAFVDLLVLPNIMTQSGVFLRPWWLDGWQWLGNLTLTETWRYHLIGSTQKALYLGHYWTLCYEEQFYAVMGILVLVAPRSLFTSATIVTIVVIVVSSTAHIAGWRIDGFFFDGRWVLFAIGILVYCSIADSEWRPYAHRIAVLLTFLAMTVAIINPRTLLESQKNFCQELVVASLFGSALLVMAASDARLANARLSQPLMYLGRISFSLYLVHLPITRFVRVFCDNRNLTTSEINPWLTILVCAGISIPVAALFYQVVERRYLNSSTLECRVNSPVLT